MKQKINFYFKKFDAVFSRILYYAMIFLACYIFTVSVPARVAHSDIGPDMFGPVHEQIDENTFIFGYRPVFVLTGSMEPYMDTNSIILTKEVTDISELAVGDVVSYHVNTNDGDTLRITHRIIEIDGEYIYTKGDNNNVPDGYPLTMDNIEAKVTSVFNQLPWLIDKWNSGTSGKILIISFAIAVILFFMTIKSVIKSFFEDENEEENTETNKISIVPFIVDRVVWAASLGVVIFTHYNAYGFVKYVKIETALAGVFVVYLIGKTIYVAIKIKKEQSSEEILLENNK